MLLPLKNELSVYQKKNISIINRHPEEVVFKISPPPLKCFRDCVIRNTVAFFSQIVFVV